MKMYPQLFKDSDYLPKLIEDVYILIYNLGRCQSVRDAYMAVITYVKLRDPKSLMQTDVVKALMEYVPICCLVAKRRVLRRCSAVRGDTWISTMSCGRLRCSQRCTSCKKRKFKRNIWSWNRSCY